MHDVVIVLLFWAMVLGPSLLAMRTNTRPEVEEAYGE